MKITVYGSGLISWVTAVGLTKLGHNVVYIGAMDESVAKVEPGLIVLWHQYVAEKRLLWAEKTLSLVAKDSHRAHHSDVHVMAMDAALTAEAQQIAKQIRCSLGKERASQTLLILQTAFEPGMARQLGATSGCDWCVVPDAIAEGCALADFLTPARIVIGADEASTVNRVKAVFASLNLTEHQWISMSPESAELTKYATNAMLATRISFMNEMAEAAEFLGADIESVRLGMGSDPRIGAAYLKAGSGFGGVAFERDLARLQQIFARTPGRGQLLTQVLVFNAYQKDVVFRKTWNHFQGCLTDKKFAVWGASYKEGSADITASPALKVIEALLAQGANVRLYSPKSKESVQRYAAQHWSNWPGQLQISDTIEQSVRGADGLLLMTQWQEFINQDFHRLQPLLHQAVVFDGRNALDPVVLREAGFEYVGIGRQ